MAEVHPPRFRGMDHAFVGIEEILEEPYNHPEDSTIENIWDSSFLENFHNVDKGSCFSVGGVETYA